MLSRRVAGDKGKSDGPAVAEEVFRSLAQWATVRLVNGVAAIGSTYHNGIAWAAWSGYRQAYGPGPGAFELSRGECNAMLHDSCVVGDDSQ